MRKSQEKKIKLNKRKLNLISERLGWIGEGTVESPLVIDSIPKGIAVLRISKISNIQIKDLIISDIELLQSRDVVVENCKIYSLGIEGSQNITAKNNWIVNIEMGYSGGCIIENNRIPWELHNSPISNNKNKTLNRSIISLAMVTAAMFTILYSVGLFHYLVSYFTIHIFSLQNYIIHVMTFISIFFIVLFSICGIITILMIRMKIKARKYPENKIVDNIITSKDNIINEIKSVL